MKIFRDNNMAWAKLQKANLVHPTFLAKIISKIFNNHLRMAEKLWEESQVKRVLWTCFHPAACIMNKKLPRWGGLSHVGKSWAFTFNRMVLCSNHSSRRYRKTTHASTHSCRGTLDFLARTTSLRRSLLLSRPGHLSWTEKRKQPKRKRLLKSHKVWRKTKEPVFNPNSWCHIQV